MKGRLHLGTAVIATLLVPTTLTSQVFTDLRMARFNAMPTVISTPQGPVIYGMAGAGESSPARWTRATGTVPLLLPPLEPLPFRLEDASADGSVVTGRGSGVGDNSNRPSAYRWSEKTGYQELTTNIRDAIFSERNRVSADGSVVIGFGAVSAYRWSAETGTVNVGALMNDIDVIGPDNPLFFPKGLSANGSVVVGRITQAWHLAGEAARWTAEEGLVGLGKFYEWEPEQYSTALAVSANGQVIAGNATTNPNTYPPSDDGLHDAFRWTEETGMVPIGSAGGPSSFVTAMSGDGALIAGGIPTGRPFVDEAFVWTPGAGMQRLVDVLTNQYGVGDQLTGLNLGPVTALSRDGRYLVGFATAADRQQIPYLVDFGMTPVPEPETYGAVTAAGLIALMVAKRRRAVAAKLDCPKPAERLGEASLRFSP